MLHFVEGEPWSLLQAIRTYFEQGAPNNATPQRQPTTRTPDIGRGCFPQDPLHDGNRRSAPPFPLTFPRFRKIPEFGGRVLRVAVNTTVEPNRVISVFFDRQMKGKL